MSKIVLNKELLNAIPFQVDGNNILVKDVDDEVLVVLPNQPTAILVRSTETIEFQYFNEDLEVVFTNYATEGDADLDFYTLQNILALSGASGGATAANQVTQIDLESQMLSNTESMTESLNNIETNSVKRGDLTVVTAAVTAVSSLILAANPNRNYVNIINEGNGVVRLGMGSTAVNNRGLRLIKYAQAESDSFVPTDAIYAITESGTATLTIETY